MTNALLQAADIVDPPTWQPEGRPKLEPHQQPPEPTPTLWLLEAGRGAGKTEAASRYFATYMRMHPKARGRIIAPTFGDAVESCIEGPSGLLTQDPEVNWIPGAKGGSKVIWPNGAEALVLGTPFPKDVERLRAAGNRDIDWWEEMAANSQLKKAWDMAALGLRRGPHPHAIASSTPRNTSDYRAIRNMPDTVLTRATLFQNPHNPKEWVDMMRKRYEGTRLGRQEVHGELLDDVAGALWTRLVIEKAFWPDLDTLPTLATVVVSIDPAASHGEDADDTGIMVEGLGVDGNVYVLADRTCHLAPEGWGAEAVKAYRRHRADYIVGEVNNGGDMVEHVIATVDPKIPFKKVHASRGKATRAQPVAALYGDGTPERPTRIRHVPGLSPLEDQLCTWVPGEENSPDRLDAHVWAVTELLLAEQEKEQTVEFYQPVRIGANI